MTYSTLSEYIAGRRYAAIEVSNGMAWWWDGAGWSSEPTYYFASWEAAERFVDGYDKAADRVYHVGRMHEEAA